ncbi:hypothetical protein ACLKA6_004713 [Drosophila palustris]
MPSVAANSTRIPPAMRVPTQPAAPPHPALAPLVMLPLPLPLLMLLLMPQLIIGPSASGNFLTACSENRNSRLKLGLMTHTPTKIGQELHGYF